MGALKGRVAASYIVILSVLSCSSGDRSSEISIGPDRVKQTSPSLEGFTHVGPRNVGYMLYDIDAKQVIVSANRTDPFIPASTTKLFTAAAALDILGADYRFETTVHMSGKADRGVLRGDICITGGGDPSLTADHLAEMADALRKTGITSVNGRYYYDESAFPRSDTVEETMDSDASYNAGLSALSVDSNMIMASWKAAPGSRHMEIVLTPSVPLFAAKTAPRELPEGIDFKFDRQGDTETWLVRPSPAMRGRKFLPVKNAGLYTAQFFSQLCRIRGISLPPPVRGSLRGRGERICRHRSKPLWELLDPMLAYSNNIMAELIMIRSACDRSGSCRPLEGSAGVIAAHFRKKMPRVNWKGFTLVNGSGLTTGNRITPEQMTALLVNADRGDYGGKKFRFLLPSSGWEQSLSSRFNRSETAFHLNAKTGTINYAVSLAGYLYPNSHRRMAFVVFVHDTERRRSFDADPDKTGRASMAKVAAWNQMSRNLIDSIVERWVKQY